MMETSRQGVQGVQDNTLAISLISALGNVLNYLSPCLPELLKIK